MTVGYHLALPYPPSLNEIWTPTYNRRADGSRHATLRLSDVARKYKADVAWLANHQGVKTRILGRVRLDLVIYPARPLDWQERMRKLGDMWDYDVRCVDGDNGVKLVIDALKNLAFEDDRRVWFHSVARGEPDARGARLEVDIQPFTRATPQRDWLTEEAEA